MADDPELRALLDQINIAFLRRLGGDLTLPVEEVDATGDWDMVIEAQDDGRIRFRLVRSPVTPS